jgi:hypothetical protein
MSLTPDQFLLLKGMLEALFVPNLPPLLDRTKPLEHQKAKNISRALPAFALHKLCGIDHVAAAQAVVDDYDDNGLDAIYYHQASKKLYLVQAKLKETGHFQQDEAMAFVKGVRDLLRQEYGLFNANTRARQDEIEYALDECESIVLVVAYSLEKVSEHADTVLKQLISDRDEVDERIVDSYEDYGPDRILCDLLAEHAVKPVDEILTLYAAMKVETPRLTYCGQAKVKDLVSLYTKHGNALLEQNIRYYLGSDTSDVNRSILNTLRDRPADFFYLNNGITALAREIHPKSNRDRGKRFKAMSLSVINGAQTLASATQFVKSNPQADIENARVMLTLIKVRSGDTFGKDVTKARNHQNPVALANFAALDPTQERLRRELAFNGIEYHYRPESKKQGLSPTVVTIEEAAVALALFSPNPDFAIIVKREPSRLLDVDGSEYKRLFGDDLSGRQVAIATRLYRKSLQFIQGNENSSTGIEKLFYRHGKNAVVWLLFQEYRQWLNNQDIPSDAEAGAMISAPLDVWRQRAWDKANVDMVAAEKGPLAFFRTLTHAKPFLLTLRDAA